MKAHKMKPAETKLFSDIIGAYNALRHENSGIDGVLSIVNGPGMAAVEDKIGLTDPVIKRLECLRVELKAIRDSNRAKLTELGKLKTG